MTAPTHLSQRKMPRYNYGRRFNFLRDTPEVVNNGVQALSRMINANPRVVTDPIVDAVGGVIEGGVQLTPPIVWDMAREHAQDIQMFRTGAGIAASAAGLISQFIPESSSSQSRKRLRSGSYKNSRPPALKLDSTQQYRTQPGTDPKKRTFAHPPWWTRARSRSSLSSSNPSSRTFYTATGSQRSNSLSQRIVRLRQLSPSHVARLERTLGWFKTRLLLRARSRRRGRPKARLASALRQASRRVLHLRKKYILVPARWKPRVRRALAKALRQRYIARRRYRNA